MEYRIDKKALLDIMEQWNQFLRKKVHLIACGGTALTLLGAKASTKDIDFMVPNLSEYEHLIKMLKQIGYEQATAYGWQLKGEIFRFDLFPEKRIHTTELLESPLEEKNHQLVKQYSRLYIGVLNEYDLIASKLIRGTGIDFGDCLMLVRVNRSIDIERLKRHYIELISYDIAEERVRVHIDHFIELLGKENLL